jgi:hypothetical protein
MTSDRNDPKPTCEVKLNTVVDQEVFRQDGPSLWTQVKRGEASLSTIGVPMAKPDNQVVLLPDSCDASAPRLRQLQNGAADSVISAFSRGSVAIDQSVRVLGLQTVVAPQ